MIMNAEMLTKSFRETGRSENALDVDRSNPVNPIAHRALGHGHRARCSHLRTFHLAHGPAQRSGDILPGFLQPSAELWPLACVTLRHEATAFENLRASFKAARSSTVCQAERGTRPPLQTSISSGLGPVGRCLSLSQKWRVTWLTPISFAAAARVMSRRAISASISFGPSELLIAGYS